MLALREKEKLRVRIITLGVRDIDLLRTIEHRVQWIRQRAARDRYLEEVELLEEELRRLIRGFGMVRDVWEKLSLRHGNENRPSFAAFAARKRKLYSIACEGARAVAKDIGIHSVP